MLKRQAEGFAALEVPLDVTPTGVARAAYLEAVNAERADRGLPPHINDEVANPALAAKRKAALDRYERRESAAHQSQRTPRTRTR